MKELFAESLHAGFYDNKVSQVPNRSVLALEVDAFKDDALKSWASAKAHRLNFKRLALRLFQVILPFINQLLILFFSNFDISSTIFFAHFSFSELRCDLTRLHSGSVQKQRLYMMRYGPPCEYTPAKYFKRGAYLSISLS